MKTPNRTKMKKIATKMTKKKWENSSETFRGHDFLCLLAGFSQKKSDRFKINLGPANWGDLIHI